MSLTLLVLAAGLGSRYGGLKQIAAVGPAGETLLDYGVEAARAAGFTRVVFVIREDFAAEFAARVGQRYAGRMEVDTVFQATTMVPAGVTVPPGRTKPWGTGHAVWCARAAVGDNFAVINADDFYGAQAYRLLADFWREAPAAGPAEFALVGFVLARTLSEHGAVSRGVCRIDASGHLLSVTEETGILPGQVGPGGKFTGREIVSMNCWGFTPAVFPLLDSAWRRFLEDLAPGDGLRAEFYLPTAISAAVQSGQAGVRVLPTDEAWFGITYPADQADVARRLAGAAAAREKNPGAAF